MNHSNAPIHSNTSIHAIQRSGEVTGIKHGLAQIQLAQTSGCSGCSSRGTCSSANTPTQIVSLQMPANTRVGDQVSVTISAASMTLVAILGYVLPPVGLLAGAVIASLFFVGDAAAVLGAGLGLATGFVLMRLISRTAFFRKLQPSVCRTADALTVPLTTHSSEGELA